MPDNPLTPEPDLFATAKDAIEHADDARSRE